MEVEFNGDSSLNYAVSKKNCIDNIVFLFHVGARGTV